MDWDPDIQSAQHIIGYEFRDKQRLREALRAAINEERDNGEIYRDDGNRRLGVLGHKLIEATVLDVWFDTGTDRKNANRELSRISDNSFLANVARESRLSVCIARSPKQMSEIPAPAMLKYAVTAIIGAVYKDSNKNMDEVARVMRQLKIM